MGYNDVIKIEDSDGIQRVISELTELAKSGKYVFRGYSKQDELLPSIIRDKVNYEDVEGELLYGFERYGSHYFHATTSIDFMSSAQHFGLPTRLLDFTYNPFIALSFALYGRKGTKYKEPEDKTYYYIRYAALEDNICITSIPLNDDLYNIKFTRTDSLATKACQSIDKVTGLFGKNFVNFNVASLIGLKSTEIVAQTHQKMKDRVILFIDPNQANQRIIMQQELFMFPYTLDKEEHLDIVKRNSSLLMIHKDLREYLLKYLDTLGFTSFRLMPDLASVCSAVTRKVTDERANKSELFKKKR